MPKLQHIRSATPDKRPDPALLADGQLSINTAAATPGVYTKNDAGALIKVGPTFVGLAAPNSSPGGSAGNSVGEHWMDTSVAPPVLRVWDGSSWIASQGLTGPQGEVGPQGPAGVDGAAGGQGPAGADGAAGGQGPAGPQGEQGIQGESGTGIRYKGEVATVAELPATGNAQGDLWVIGNRADDASPAESYIWNQDTTKWDYGGKIQGPQGPAGNDGAAGAQGPAGNDGAQGPQGEIGPQGPAGIDGAQGPAGPQGEQGIQGQAGIGIRYKGEVAAVAELPTTGNVQGDLWVIGNRADDTSPAESYIWNEGTTTWDYGGKIQGPQGPQGPAGIDGAAGVQGPAGTDGAAGGQGPQGEVGPQGPAGVDGAAGGQGPQGPAGNDGAVGGQGPQGEVGPQGPAGTDGAAGGQGPQGEVGPQGPAGNDGAAGGQGPAGNDGAVGPQGPQGDSLFTLTPGDQIVPVEQIRTLQITGGSATSPAYGCIGGVGTGISFPSATELQLNTENVARLTINSAGGWNVNGSSSEVGLVLTGNGWAAPPSWQAPKGAAGGTLFASVAFSPKDSSFPLGNPQNIAAVANISQTGPGGPRDGRFAVIFIVPTTDTNYKVSTSTTSEDTHLTNAAPYMAWEQAGYRPYTKNTDGFNVYFVANDGTGRYPQESDVIVVV